jgi:hypothetical protein
VTRGDAVLCRAERECRTESGPRLPVDATVSLTIDADGRVAAATLSPSTDQLLLTRRKDEPGLALEAWRQV